MTPVAAVIPAAGPPGGVKRGMPGMSWMFAQVNNFEVPAHKA